MRKDYRNGTLRYNLPMSAHASQAFSTLTVPIRKIYLAIVGLMKLSPVIQT